MSFDAIVILIVLLPFLAAVLNGAQLLADEKLWDWRTTQTITCVSILLSFLGSIWVFGQVLDNPAARNVVAYRWMFSGDLSVNFAFLIDPLSSVMMLVVTGFSYMIAMFSRNYMHRDYSFTRYFSVVALFVFAMLILVMGNNFVMLFLGWEAVGVCSYLLIGHYYSRTSAARAGTKAFVMNRVGDAGFLMGIFLIFANFGSLDYAVVFAKAARLDSFTANAICLCLLLGAIGKSAQLPLGTWLAKAMEGPTPSSALIHAATMVTAGVYMLTRAHALYDVAPEAMAVVTIVGALTAVYGATVGLALTDIKGILAFSTTTQLGLMFVACGLGAYPVAIFHLVAHAFFKSYLFLTAPSILHYFHGFPDATAVDAKSKPLPVAYWIVLIGCIGVGAYPFVSSWLSGNPETGLHASYYVLLAAAGMAVFTMVYFGLTITRRMFSGHGHGGHDDHADDHEIDWVRYAIPVLSLVAAVAVGALLDILPGGMAGTWFGKFLAPIVTISPTVAATSMLSYGVVAAIGLLFLSGWTTAVFMDRYATEVPGGSLLKMRRIYNLALHRFYIDEFYGKYVVGVTERLGRAFERFDTKVIDRIVGAPISQTPMQSEAATWEARYLAARAAGITGGLGVVTARSDTALADSKTEAQGSGVLNWLTKTSAGTSGWVEKEVVTKGSGMVAGLTAMASNSSQTIEREVVSGGAGLIGSMTAAASHTSSMFEKDIISGASGLIGAITDVAAFISHWVEMNVFDRGVSAGVSESTGAMGSTFNTIEDVLATPLVAGALVVGAVILSFWGAM